jgi:8-oxo-dGTP pyrophosphatase MutT (NUDIX family)
MPMSEYLRQLRRKVGSEFILAAGVTMLVFDEQNRVLLVRQQDDELWSIPGGTIDPFQTLIDVAVREMREQTGLYVQPFRIIGAYGGDETFYQKDSQGNQVIYVTIVLEAKIIGGALKPNVTKIIELRYFNQTEIEHLDTHNRVRMILHDAYRHRNQTNFDPPAWSPPSTEN